MEIVVENFKGIKLASFIASSGITIVGGLNAAGKSSIAQAVASALTGLCPIVGTKKTDYMRFVHAGLGTANVTLRVAGGTSTMSYPEGASTREGVAPPVASQYAAGVSSPAFLTEKEAAGAWGTILKSSPTTEELTAALASVPQDVRTLVTSDVTKLGYDGAHAKWKENGARLKGRWEEITGQRYGVKVAQSWQPLGYLFAAEKTLIDEVEKHRKALEEAIKDQGATQAEKEQAGQLQALEKVVAELCAQEAQAQKSVKEEREKLEKLPLKLLYPECPHCEKSFMLQISQKGETIISRIPTNPPDAAGVDAALNDAKKALQKAQNDEGTKRLAFQNAEHDRKKAYDASQKFKQGAPGDDTEAKRTALEIAEYQLTAHNNYNKAKAVAADIEFHAKVVKILAPEGLRAHCLGVAVDRFNGELSALCTAAKWPVVKLEIDLTLSYNARPYLMLSMSEQYRTRATVQAAIARRENASMMIFDGADILTKNGKGGLWRMAQVSKIPTLILMSVDSQESLPKVPFGYWLENGGICALGETVPKAA